MMRRIVGFAPTLLGLKEQYLLGKRLAKDVAAEFAEDGYLTVETASIRAGLATIEAALLNSRKSPHSKVLKQKHAVRGRAFSGLVGILDGMTELEVRPEVCAAAVRVLAVVEQFGRDAGRLGYVKGSATISALLQELKSARMQADLEVLKIADVIARLETVHNDFEAAYWEKLEAEDRDVHPTAQAARQDVIFHLTNGLQYIDSLANREPVKYAKVIEDINTIIQDVGTAARARHTRLVNEAEEVKATLALPPAK
jgi:hypothetical protein